MSPDEEIKMPVQTGSPTEQHGQIMFVLGQIIATQRGIMARQDITNGKVVKNTGDIEAIQKWQATSDGEETGVSRTWAIIFTVASLVVGVLATYVALRH